MIIETHFSYNVYAAIRSYFEKIRRPKVFERQDIAAKKRKNEVTCSKNHDTPGNYRDFLFKKQAPLVAMRANLCKKC